MAWDAGQLLVRAVHNGAFAAALLGAHEVHEALAAEPAAVVLGAWAGPKRGSVSLGLPGLRPEVVGSGGEETRRPEELGLCAYWSQMTNTVMSPSLFGHLVGAFPALSPAFFIFHVAFVIHQFLSSGKPGLRSGALNAFVGHRSS